MRRSRLFRTSTTVLLTLVVLTTSGIFTQMPLRVPVARAASPAIPPAGPAPAGAVPFSRQPAPTLPIGTWQPRTPAASPTATATGAAGQQKVGTAAAVRSPGEQMDLRTANSQTFLNADGTYTLQAFDGPIHYQDTQGAWQTIDTAVVGDTADAGYAYGVTANDCKVHFARQSGVPK